MKKILPLTILPLALASCNMFGVPNGDVSGNILGTQPSGNIRMAFQGLTVAGFQAPVADQINIPTFNPEKRAYTVSLPTNPADGAYELLAYVDGAGSKPNHYDIGEQRTAVTGKTFIYSKDGLGKKDGTSLLNLKPGWTLYNVGTLKVEKSGTPFTGYDLNW